MKEQDVENANLCLAHRVKQKPASLNLVLISPMALLT